MEIRNSKISGEKSLFATKNYNKGEIVHILSGDIYDKPKRESIHIGNNKHIYNKFGIYINHLIRIFMYRKTFYDNNILVYI